MNEDPLLFPDPNEQLQKDLEQLVINQSQIIYALPIVGETNAR